MPAPAARVYVLAAGGVRTTQMLLALQRSWPSHFGGSDGVLGRHYMGHVAGEIATVVFEDAARAHPFLFRSVDGLRQQRLLRLDPSVQRDRQTLNTSFMLRHPPFADTRHRSGILSLIHLAYPGTAGWTPFRSPGLRDAVRSRSASRDARLKDTRGHIRNVASDLPGMVGDIARIALRKIDRRGNVPLLGPNRGGAYTLRNHAEQSPDPESRIRLGVGSDAHGVPDLDIDFRYADRDIRSVIDAHEALDHGLRSSGGGHLEYWNGRAGREDAIRALAVDGYHQIGSARMGSDPSTSTVDGEGRVHGLRNLFVASSCVFPTSGYANPTLTIVALALRTAQGVGRAVRACRQGPARGRSGGGGTPVRPRRLEGQRGGEDLRTIAIAHAGRDPQHIAVGKPVDGRLQQALDGGLTRFHVVPALAGKGFSAGIGAIFERYDELGHRLDSSGEKIGRPMFL